MVQYSWSPPSLLDILVSEESEGNEEGREREREKWMTYVIILFSKTDQSPAASNDTD